jgi:hypothetical protein
MLQRFQQKLHSRTDGDAANTAFQQRHQNNCRWSSEYSYLRQMLQLFHETSARTTADGLQNTTIGAILPAISAETTARTDGMLLIQLL